MLGRSAAPLSALLAATWLTSGIGLGGCSNDTFVTGGGGEGGTNPGSGGAPATGGSGGGTAECSRDTECVAAANQADPCFSPSCSVPEGRLLSEVQTDPCLQLWEDRNEPVPEQCRPDETPTCPGACAMPPTCITPRCNGGTCSLDVGYSEQECSDGTDTDCSEKIDELRAAIAEARVCDPGLMDGKECTGNATMDNECGCEVLLNDANPSKVEAARGAYDDWSSACEPPPECANLGCAPTTGFSTCARSSNGDGGFCTYKTLTVDSPK